MGPGAPEGFGPGSALPPPPPGHRVAWVAQASARAFPTCAARARAEHPGPGSALERRRPSSTPAGSREPPLSRLSAAAHPSFWETDTDLEESLGWLVAGDLASGPDSAWASHPKSPGHGSLISKMEDGGICPPCTTGIAGWPLPAWNLSLNPAALRLIWAAFQMLRHQNHRELVIRGGD